MTPLKHLETWNAPGWESAGVLSDFDEGEICLVEVLPEEEHHEIRETDND